MMRGSEGLLSKTVLVIGASGFVGGAVARRFEEGGWSVRQIVGPRSENRSEKKDRVSLLDPNALAGRMRGVDVVVMAAGVVQPGLAREIYQWVHVAAAENVLSAARHAGVSRLVHVSCADVVLADEDRVHWDEKRDLSGPPIGARAQSLKLAEELVLAGGDDELSVTAIRPGWIWGPGDRSTLPQLIREARAGGIALYGDGRNLVSTSYIKHVSEAIWAAALAPNARDQVYYVGDSEFLEMREFLAMLSTSLGLPPPRTGMPGWLAQVLSKSNLSSVSAETLAKRQRGTLFDTQKLAAELGCSPRYSIDEGMKALKEWVSEIGGVDALAQFVAPPSASVEELRKELRDAELSARAQGEAAQESSPA